MYDTSNNTFRWKDGDIIVQPHNVDTSEPVPAKIQAGKRNLSTIKIQLGLSCNFECDYCNQRFVPRAEETNPDDVGAFVDNMANWFSGGEDGLGKGTRFEYWGGEPFVYWKTFKPLAEAIIKKYPNAENFVITNGSLLDLEKIMWLDKYNFHVGVSHDGPGQHVRGPDPLADETSKMAIVTLFKLLSPKHKISFNAMMNSKNTSREDISTYFEKFVAENVGELFVVISRTVSIPSYKLSPLRTTTENVSKEVLSFR